MVFRGSVQLLRVVFPVEGERPCAWAEFGLSSINARPRFRVQLARQVKVVMVYKDGNEQITGHRRVARQSQDD